MIGGSVSGDANLISGNTDTGSTSMVIQRRTRSSPETRSAPTSPAPSHLPNATGVEIGSARNHDRRDGGEAQNVISGNTHDGIQLDPGSQSVVVKGNFIGTNAAGTAALGNSEDGILVNSSSDTIGGTTAGAGNLISGNTEDGVEIGGYGTSGTLVEGNYIGTDVTGTVAVRNLIAGVEIDTDASGNTIGGLASSAASFVNLISGNGFAGVLIEGSGTEGNVVAGNWIGTTQRGIFLARRDISEVLHVLWHHRRRGCYRGGRLGQPDRHGRLRRRFGRAGTSSRATTTMASTSSAPGRAATWSRATGSASARTAPSWAIRKTGSTSSRTSGDTIGGITAGAGNVIDGNYDGIQIYASTLVEGNVIGTNAAGTAALGNRVDGIEVVASGVTIGGTVDGAGNVISGNADDGVEIIGSGATGNVVAGDFIGTDVTGTFAIPNTNDGIDVSDSSSGNTIGIAVAGGGNVIGGNGVYAIEINGSSNNLMMNNTIGMKADLSGALGNGVDAINIGNGSTREHDRWHRDRHGQPSRMHRTRFFGNRHGYNGVGRMTTLCWGTRSD